MEKQLDIQKLKAQIDVAEHRLNFLHKNREKTIKQFRVYLIALIITLVFAFGFLIPLIIPFTWSNLFIQHQIFYSLTITFLIVVSTALIIKLINLRKILWQFDIIINEGDESILFARNCLNINKEFNYGHI